MEKILTEIASTTATKIVKECVNAMDIKIPTVNKEFWLGNYCLKIKIGG